MQTIHYKREIAYIEIMIEWRLWGYARINTTKNMDFCRFAAFKKNISIDSDIVMFSLKTTKRDILQRL